MASDHTPILLPGTPIGAPGLSHNCIVDMQSIYGHTCVYTYVCAELPGTPLDLRMGY